MNSRTVALLGSLSKNEEQILVDALRARCNVAPDEKPSLKSLFIQAYGESEEDVYFGLAEEIEAIRKLYNAF